MFSESVKKCILNYIKIKGRTSRKTYWYFLLLVLICLFIFNLFVFDFVIYHGTMSLYISYVFLLALLFFLVPSITATCRRLHDIGKPTPWIFIFLVPILGFILWLVWCVRKSDGDNSFGKKIDID